MEKLRFGMSSCEMQELTEENFIDMKNSGVKELELSFSPQKYKSLDWNRIRKSADKFGINLWSLHLPFSPFSEINHADSDVSINQNTIKYFGELIEKAAAIGIKVMVVHPSGEPVLESEREEQLETAGITLSKLAAIAEKHEAVIAVENLPRTCIGRNSCEIKKLLSFDDRLRVCFDTNHLLEQDTVNFILDVGEKIITTHISDYDRENERHWLPGEGVIAWKEVVDALEKTDYKGPLLYEVKARSCAAINRRELTLKDFKNNHLSLIDRVTPLRIGKPIKENCFNWRVKPW